MTTAAPGSRLEKGIRFLRQGDWAFCLALALGVIVLFAGAAWNDAIEPAGDGLGYATRAFALYGFLHTGQWSAFANLVVRPCQSILPPNDPLFFLLPKGLAGPNSYAVTMWLATFGLLAWAVCEIGRALDRREWAAPLFLLCVVHTIALSDFYAFYLDETFLALALLAAARQIRAWRNGTAASQATAGALIGALFWLKPANALIVVGVFVLSEMVHAFLAARSKPSVPPGKHRTRHRWWLLAGFLLVAGGAFACGAGQTIIGLFDDNEVHPLTTPLQCTGLLRFFYFPLCVAYYYHVVALVAVLLLAVVVARWIPRLGVHFPGTPFPLHYFLPIAIGYLILGEFFSFFMAVKPMRFLAIILPIAWVGIFHFLENRRVPLVALYLFALLYTGLALSQKAFGVLPVTSQLVEDNYQLAWKSWIELPRSWNYGLGLKNSLCSTIQDAITPGAVCVNSIELRDALFWRLDRDDLLAGRASRAPVKILFNQRSQCYENALIGAHYLVLITFGGTQTSKTSWLLSEGLLGYANEVWFQQERRIDEMPLPGLNGAPSGFLLRFHPPLAPAEVRAAITTLRAQTTPPSEDGDRVNRIEGRHYSETDAAGLMRDWLRLRLDY